MNKYALMLPLVTLSIFLGYVSSNPQTEQTYIVVTTTTLGIGTILLFFIAKSHGEKK